MPTGRPTKYKSEFVKQAKKLALLGATDKQVADFFCVNELTINRWKGKYPDFCKSLKEGKVELDNQVVKSLYFRAIGYKCPEDKIFNNNGDPLIVPTTKHYPPDPTSLIFWLKNRQPAEWRDKQEHEHTGKDGQALKWVIEYKNADNTTSEET